jgi:maltokinase
VITRAEWAALIGEADASLVLPVRPRGAVLSVVGPLQLVDALPLSDHTCVALIADGSADRWVTPLIAAGGGVRRARAGDGVAEHLVALLTGPSETLGAFSKVCWSGHGVVGERAVTVDQTNDSIIVGDAAIVKWTVRAPALGEPGSPAAARITTLTKHHFDAMPEPWGLLTWNDGVEDITVATVAAYLPGAEDGWDWAVREVADYATGAATVQPTGAVQHLGAMAADMHAALRDDGIERATPELAATWHRRAIGDLDEALLSVDGPELARLTARALRIRQALESLAEVAGTPLINIHGDFHIGQILRFGDPSDYVVTDFDGSPVLSPHDRVAKHPAAVDIISMLASLDHVGRVVLKRVDGADEHRVRTWIEASQVEFLASYRRTLGAQRYAELVDASLFAPLRLQQELREYIYAAGHLPHWKYVPDLALQDLLPDEE